MRAYDGWTNQLYPQGIQLEDINALVDSAYRRGQAQGYNEGKSFVYNEVVDESGYAKGYEVGRLAGYREGWEEAVSCESDKSHNIERQTEILDYLAEPGHLLDDAPISQAEHWKQLHEAMRKDFKQVRAERDSLIVELDALIAKNSELYKLVAQLHNDRMRPKDVGESPICACCYEDEEAIYTDIDEL